MICCWQLQVACNVSSANRLQGWLANEVVTVLTLAKLSTRSTVLQGLWQRLQNYNAAALPKNILNDNAHHRRKLATILRKFVPNQAELTSRVFVARTSRSMRIGGTASAAVIAPGDFALEYPIPLAPNLQVGVTCVLPVRMSDCGNHISAFWSHSVSKYHHVDLHTCRPTA